MRIASITMVGQFPHGIDLHVRNLRWALGPEDHIFVVTTPAVLAETGLASDARVTYIPLQPAEIRAFGYLNFWQEFPAIVARHRIEPEWFLFMEQDIWFYRHPTIHAEPRHIRSYLPWYYYHNIMVGDRMLHPRVWEGAQLVHGSLVRDAIAAGIGFSKQPGTFVDRARAVLEAEHGGPIGLSDFGRPDTMDEFGLHCALVARTRLDYDVRAVHLRGPEVLHRLHPHIYRGSTPQALADVQARMHYLDTLLAVAVYYVAGLWDEIDHLDWSALRPGNSLLLDDVLETAACWMQPGELARLERVRRLATR